MGRKKKKLPEFQDAPIAGVNIVPVIDLCLVLLVILLIIAPLIEKPDVEVILPKAQTKEDKENNIAVTINPAGDMALNAERIDRSDLPRLLPLLLLEQGEDTAVVIRADKEVAYRDLTDLLKDIKKAGAQRIAIGTDPPNEVTEGKGGS